jgi:hypothetical protein
VPAIELPDDGDVQDSEQSPYWGDAEDQRFMYAGFEALREFQAVTNVDFSYA